jgi:hypothetical protein
VLLDTHVVLAIKRSLGRLDRLLVAQALLEGLPIVTVDPRIRMYDVETIG